MKKEIGKLILRFFSVVVPAVLILMGVARFLPFMYYMDGEYAMYKQNVDYVRKQEAYVNAPWARTVIIGDSRAKAGFVPDILGPSCYNLALGGSTPVEGYYTLKEYLACHSAPEYVVVAFAPIHYMEIGSFWNRSVYFHCMEREDIEEIFATAKELGDKEYAKKYYRLHDLMYRFYFPNKYGAALRRSIASGRLEQNLKMYEETDAARGQHYFGTMDSATGVVGEAGKEDFSAAEMERVYMQKLLDLAKDHGCKVIVENLPFSLTSYRIFTQEFKDGYQSYMEELAIANPDVSVYTYFYCYDDSCFGDNSHLNKNGAEAYSLYIKERYPDAFP